MLVIDAATGTVTRTIPVGNNPTGVAVDPATRTVYVTSVGLGHATDGTVLVIDAATGAVTRTIPVGGAPVGVAVDPAARTAYVANAGYGAGGGTDKRP